MIRHPKKMGITERAVQNRTVKEELITAPLDVKDLVENIDFLIKNENRLRNAVSYQTQYKRARAKSARLWSGIMRHLPFQEQNELAALLACDALLRQNGFKLIPFDKHKVAADIYCFYTDFYKVAPSADALGYLKIAFVMKKVDDPGEVWGFVKEYPEVVEYIKRRYSEDKFSYEE